METTDPSPRPAYWQVPPLRREEGYIAGVSAAIATELGVNPTSVRGAFILLFFQGGWGAVLYGVAWLALALAPASQANLYQPQPKGRSERARYGGLALLMVGLMLVGEVLGFTVTNPYLVPFGLLALGVILAWSRRGEESGAWVSLRIVGAITLAVAAVAIGVYYLTAGSLGIIAISLAIMAPVIVVALPTLARFGRELDSERSERVRADERAKVAVHLHDSVLQTLTLIQKNAADPDRMAQLARQQERELRAWLYGTSPPDASATRMEPALLGAATLIEQRHAIQVNVVVVGDDRSLPSKTLGELIAATQEALTNAAKHAQVGTVDVYAEVGVDLIEVFIRDDGKGFDRSVIAEDRHGLADSIEARMDRLGGTATIVSEPGEGTEVELSLPLTNDEEGLSQGEGT